MDIAFCLAFRRSTDRIKKFIHTLQNNVKQLATFILCCESIARKIIIDTLK